MRFTQLDYRLKRRIMRRRRDREGGFWLRKAERAEVYFRWRFGWRSRPCSACNGSGRYDDDGSPPCGGCDGTGREQYRGPLASETAFLIHAPHLAEILRHARKS